MTEAKMMLNQVYALQQAHYYQYDRYGERLEAIGFEHARLQSEGGTARYRIGIEEASPGAYVATATALVDFDQDGTFNVWTVTEEGIITQRTPD